MNLVNKPIFARLSELSKIDFTPAEEEKLTEELNSIIAFIGLVKDFDGDFDDMKDAHAVAYSSLRKDEKKASATLEQLFANVESENDCYVIPKVVD